MRVRVNQQLFDESFCQTHFQQARGRNPQQPEEKLRQHLAEELVRQALLRQEADRRFPDGVPASALEAELARVKGQFAGEEQFQAMCRQNGLSEEGLRQELAAGLRVRALIRELVGKMPPPPLPILKEYYERDPAISTEPLQVRVRQILKRPEPHALAKTFNQMLEIRKAILAGADFTEMAEKHSENRDQLRVDLGLLPPGRLVPEFDAIVFSLELGEISPVFLTGLGYHLATVLEIQPAKRLAFELCKERLEAILLERYREQRLEAWFAESKKKAQIEVLF